MKSNQERLHWVRNIALNGRSSSISFMLQLLTDILACVDGLSVVLKALPRCCPWPQVELHVSYHDYAIIIIFLFLTYVTAP